MSHTFQISDEEYAELLKYAQWRGEPLESVFEEWLDAFADCMEFQQSILRKQAGLEEEEEEEEEEYDDPFLQQVRRIHEQYANQDEVTHGA